MECAQSQPKFAQSHPQTLQRQPLPLNRCRTRPEAARGLGSRVWGRGWTEPLPSEACAVRTRSRYRGTGSRSAHPCAPLRPFASAPYAAPVRISAINGGASPP
eukprot:2672694-Rhodomonas_salina.1